MNNKANLEVYFIFRVISIVLDITLKIMEIEYNITNKYNLKYGMSFIEIKNKIKRWLLNENNDI